MQRTEIVGLHYLLNYPERQFFYRANRCNTRVVDQRVDLTGLSQHSNYNCTHRFIGVDTHRQNGNGQIIALGELRQFGRVFGVSHGGENGVAATGHQFGSGKADAGTATGNENS